jgi:hypothetical protein
MSLSGWLFRMAFRKGADLHLAYQANRVDRRVAEFRAAAVQLRQVSPDEYWRIVGLADGSSAAEETVREDPDWWVALVLADRHDEGYGEATPETIREETRALLARLPREQRDVLIQAADVPPGRRPSDAELDLIWRSAEAVFEYPPPEVECPSCGFPIAAYVEQCPKCDASVVPAVTLESLQKRSD